MKGKMQAKSDEAERLEHKSGKSMLKYSRFGIQLWTQSFGAPRDFKTENMFIEEIDWLLADQTIMSQRARD